jgi:hypothetical protein
MRISTKGSPLIRYPGSPGIGLVLIGVPCGPKTGLNFGKSAYPFTNCNRFIVGSPDLVLFQLLFEILDKGINTRFRSWFALRGAILGQRIRQVLETPALSVLAYLPGKAGRWVNGELERI